MNIADMRAKGCELSAEEIYAADRSSLKDAIVIFGAGCTGEVVSPEGLLLTNHHCGYGAIQSLSSVEHDFLKNGFWARSRAEELPAPGLEVRFVRRIADVTADVLGAVPSTAMGEERAELVKKQVAEVRKRFGKEYPGMEISVKPFFGGNQYFAFAMEVYKDIRLVGTPPIRSASSAATPTTGCGRAIRAISRCSASTPARTTVRRSIRRRMSPIALTNTCAFRSTGTTKEISP